MPCRWPPFKVSAISSGSTDPRFLLDQHFSHWLGQLHNLGYAIQQVQLVADLGIPVPGHPYLRHKATDREIAEWCAATGYTVVTCDSDFAAKELRLGVFVEHGVKVILCSPPPESAKEQVELVARHYDKWVDAVAGAGPKHKLWTQRRFGRLR